MSQTFDDDFSIDDVGENERFECPEEGCLYVAPGTKAFKTHYASMHDPPYPYERTSPYGPHWDRQKRRAVERDEYSCVECGATANRKGGSVVIHVHHRDGDKQNNDLDNLETLCRQHHHAKHY